MGSVSVLFSYSHKDEALRDELATHLAGLRRSGLLSEWHDRRIPAGDDWKAAIDEHLGNARLILLLVSADFLASNYCYEIEMKRALARRDAGQARVVPIIVRPCDWHDTPIGALQALPKDGKPVTEWPNRDVAWTDVARGLKIVVETLSRE